MGAESWLGSTDPPSRPAVSNTLVPGAFMSLMERGVHPADLLITHTQPHQKIQSHSFGMAELSSVPFIIHFLSVTSMLGSLHGVYALL